MRRLLLLLGMVTLCMHLSAQQRTITGKVTDATGKPVPNVSVIIKGGSAGTSTGPDGSYSLSVPSSAKALVFSGIGFTDLEINIGSKSKIDASLAFSDRNLQEVVVVGYGTQKKQEVTAAVGKIDPGPISTLVTPSVDKQLGGRTAGVQVTNPSGLVNQPPRIRIRGVNSVSGGRDPLIVLDGTPIFTGGFSGVTNDNLLADINPNDIESIDVLKDGSATAIYGSRAANGVILITTKKGRGLSGSSRLNYSVTLGFAKPYKKFDLLNGDQFVTIANEKLAAASQAAQAFNPKGINTDWQGIVERSPARSQIHNLSVEGSTEKTNYFVSFNYSNQQGIIITNASKRYAIRANVEQKVNKWLKITNNITLSRSEDADQNNGGNSLSGAIYNSLRALPDVSPYDTANKTFSGYNVTSDGKALGIGDNTRLIDNNNTNIAYVLAKNKFKSTKHRIIDNIGLEIKPTSWLTYNAKANIDYVTLNDFQSLDPLHGDGQSSGGVVFNQAANSIRWVLQNYLNATHAFGNNNVALTVGSELQDERNNSYFAQGTSVADVFFQQQNIISNSFATQQSGGGYSEGPGIVSYFARLNYDFSRKYFLQGTFRRDGLSVFATNKRYGNFPGFSAGYRISEEEFWKKSGLGKIFNEVKLRGSWAKVGNTNIAGGNFVYANLYGLRPYGALSGIAASQIGNADISWETNDKIDFGTDIALFDNRINVTVDYFKNKNNNLVQAAPLPVSFGIPGNSIVKNVGSMENQGIELAVNATVIKGRDFSWDFGINYTNQSNKVLSLYQNADLPLSGGAGGTYNLLRVGEGLNALYGYRYAGVNQLNGNPMYYKSDNTLIQGNVTDTKYYTVNADGSLGSATTLAGSDRIILGTPLLKYFGGITSTFRYKGFSLDMLWRYAGGNKIMNITRQESLLAQGFVNNGTEILDRWTTKGQVTNVPRVWYGRDNFTNLNSSASTRFIENGSFIRLDNLQLTYTLDNTLL
ncbi:MAG: SusC/RagA family TonB-linked outer membrane protein, partial [Bacteroidetes bacterium]|nr:SusC/RagA family TonB-linked outer membrane protein [Bacteroidota bacterium]